MTAGYQHTIHFSLAEAQTLLPDVIAQLTEMQELKRQVDAKGYDMRRHRYFGGMGPNGRYPYPQELEKLVSIYEDLSSLGVVLKDIDRGLVDFPFLRENGEEVYLCYLLGEQTITHWHRIEDGFAGRRSVDDL